MVGTNQQASWQAQRIPSGMTQPASAWGWGCSLLIDIGAIAACGVDTPHMSDSCAPHTAVALMSKSTDQPRPQPLLAALQPRTTLSSARNRTYSAQSMTNRRSRCSCPQVWCSSIPRLAGSLYSEQGRKFKCMQEISLMSGDAWATDCDSGNKRSLLAVAKLRRQTITGSWPRSWSWSKSSDERGCMGY